MQVDNWASWSEGYSYDRYGNRAVTTRTSPLPALTGETPNALTWYGTSNNRIGGSFTYDGRGNMTVAPGRTAAYDGANQMSQEQRTGGPAVYYWYDAAGKRVGKNDLTTATIFVYDAVGRLAEEFSGPTTGFANQNVTSHIYGAGHVATEKTGLGRQYYTTDHLGSTRVITDASGGVVSASDYLPFGEEIGVGCGTLASGVKFTSQYRDQESCLDYFVSRYLSPAQGRFTSPDAVFADQHPQDPQSWNLYSYVRNNPLIGIDPTGHEIKYAPNLKNMQLTKDTVDAILGNPNLYPYLAGYLGSDSPDLLIQSGDLGPPTQQTMPDGSIRTTTTQGDTVPDVQMTSFNGGPPESQLSRTTITIDNRTSKGDTPGVIIHESVHAGEAQMNPAQFIRDERAERTISNHDLRPQEQRANAARDANVKAIEQRINQIEQVRKKVQR